MTVTVLVASLAAFFCLAVIFRRTIGGSEPPRPSRGEPALHSDLAEAIVRFDKWRSEGRISREDYERFMKLCQEDAAVKEKSEGFRS
ncbi:MAG TPA: hypothetical protein P5079_10590 [Elusimicrobiota bacterium]|nr:hypothetical protein [Elusimicrobiota bacterium]